MEPFGFFSSRISMEPLGEMFPGSKNSFQTMIIGLFKWQ